MSEELYPGQAEVVAGKLREEEALQSADRERLRITEDPAQREVILRRIAGREGSLSTRRRFLAKITGGEDEGPRAKVVPVRYTEPEYDQIIARSSESAMTVSEYIRSRSLD